ncbi:MAG: adenylate/guanylate cyclase domain-containing protein, partial [Alphaproteobacteria bacterium]
WRSGQAGAMSISFATDRPGGFRDAEIGLLDSLLPTLALGVRAAVASTVATSALETYLGPDAAQRVLSGEIIRGTTDTIDAAICYADLSGFTAVSDTLSAEDLVTTINAYMDCMALPFTSRGGEVLKFTGDGMLASFQLADRDHADVCRTALDAVEDAQDRVLALNAKRMERGQDIMGLDMALHLGEVRYGNVGAADRLDFTVIGPTVNEASRIEALSGTLDYPVLISETFARAALHCGARLSEIGRVRLRGVRTPRLVLKL